MQCGVMDKPGVLVTVGTTKFDSLVSSVSTAEFARRLYTLGYRWLRVQVGTGAKPDFEGESILQCTWFDLTPDMPSEMRKAALIISHAGAGSVMEALTFHKPLIVCVNESLMGNHQEELASELRDRRHLIVATPGNICEALVEPDSTHFTPYTDFDNFGSFSLVVDEERNIAKQNRDCQIL